MDSPRLPYEINKVDRLVGLVVVIALIVVAIGVVRHFRGNELPTVSLEYFSLLERSYGIAQGANIRLAGITIGKVTKVSLEQDGKVRLDVQISREYGNFVTTGSYLEVASAIGLEAIVDLTRLDFVSNRKSKERLPSGSQMKIVEPTNLSEVINVKEVAKLAKDVKAILHNLAQLSGTVVKHQELISKSLLDVKETTTEIRKAVRSLPKITDSATKGFDSWEKAGTKLDKVIEDAAVDIHRIGSNTLDASERLKASMKELQQLIDEANRLSDKLNRHWLLGGGKKDKKATYSPSIHPYDDLPKLKE